jgi:hypothetical protein
MHALACPLHGGPRDRMFMSAAMRLYWPRIGPGAQWPCWI